MDIYEQIQRFEDLKEYVTTQLPIFAQQVAANDLAALVTNRVVQKGENYLGAKFSPYSTKTVAAFRFWGKSRTQAAERRVRALSKARGALSYEGFRKLNNLETSGKNFEFTGEMWRKFGIVNVAISGQSFTVSLGGTSPTAQQKIDDNSQREGLSIIEASEAEEKIVQAAVTGWLNRNADRILNG